MIYRNHRIRARLAASVALAAFARASAALAEPIALDSLPVANPAASPSQAAPAHIPAGEKLAGFVVSGPSPAEIREMEQGWGGRRRIAVAATKIDEGRSDVFSPSDARGDGPCFSLDVQRGGAQRVALIETTFVEPAPNSPGAKSRARMSSQQLAWEKSFRDGENRRRKRHPVESVRSTRLVDGGADPRLELVDAWVDTETLGVRLAGKTSLPLKRLASVFGGAVYAARDGAKVAFVIAPARPPEGAHEFHGVAGQLPSGLIATASCGPVRVDLGAAPGSGQMSTALFDAYLPGKPDPDATPEQTRDQQLLRLRAVAVHLSVSQLLSEPAPIATVSFDWAGAGEQRSFRPPANQPPSMGDRAF